MPENKRTFKVGNDIYDIDESQVSEFTKDAPDAIEVKSFLVEKDTFDIPLSDVDGFLKDVPNAKPLFNETTGEGKRAAKGAISGALGKLQAEPTKSGGSGSATKRTPQNVELQSQFPTNLQADQTQELIESNIQGAELAGLDYEAISKQMAGKSPIDVAFEQVNKIQDPEEKFKTTRSLYKLAINDVSDANTTIRGNVEQMEQGMLQMQEQYEQGLNQYNQLLEQGDQESANIIGEELNKQQENLKLAATQYEDLVKEYNDNAKFLGILNAGRAASYQTAKGQEGLTTGKLPIGAAMFSNMIGGTTMQFSPEETMAASAWNAITPNLVRTLASGIEIADYFVRPGSLESTNLSKMAGDALLDFANDIEVETEKFVPKGTELNIFKELNPYSAGQFAGSLIGSVAGSIGSGGLAGTGKAAMVFNAAQGYGGMYGWGKEAGLSSAEASALAAPVGLVYGYLGDKGVEKITSVVGRESFKKIVLKGIKELGKDKTPKALSEVFLKSLQEFGKNTVKGAARESLQEGAEFSSEFWTKRLAVETGLAKTEDDLTFEAFMSGLEDSMKGGALGGGLLGGLLGASPRRTLATVVSESVNDPIKEQDFMDNMNALLNGTQIDQQQYDEVMQMYNRAKEVNNTVPSNVTNEQARAEAIDLIQERDDLQAQVEVIDPAMAKPFNDRIASIDQRLGEISEGKSITQTEDIQQQQEGETTVEDVQQSTSQQSEIEGIDAFSDEAKDFITGSKKAIKELINEYKGAVDKEKGSNSKVVKVLDKLGRMMLPKGYKSLNEKELEDLEYEFKLLEENPLAFYKKRLEAELKAKDSEQNREYIEYYNQVINYLEDNRITTTPPIRAQEETISNTNTQQQEQEGLTSVEQPETPVETVDLTPQETPVQPTETIEQPKAEFAESPALKDVESTAKALEEQAAKKPARFLPDDKVILSTKDGKQVEVNFRGYNNFSETKAVIFGDRGSGVGQMEVDVFQLRRKSKTDKLSDKERNALMGKIDLEKTKYWGKGLAGVSDTELIDLVSKHPNWDKLTQKEKQERNDFETAITPIQARIKQEWGEGAPENIVNEIKAEHKKAITNIIGNEKYANQLSEAYHKAKADGSNPELVKAVESLLSKEQEAKGQQEVETPSSNYEIAQEVTSEVSKENPNASVLLTPKGNDLSLTAVFVPSERRNQGIGTKVLESVKKQADRAGKKVVLEATNELDSETDIERLGNFYERNGFTKTGENTFEYDPSKKESIEERPVLKSESSIVNKLLNDASLLSLLGIKKIPC
jgi:ribosomal protein S18 acetylase RimI-like enzyme